MDKPPIIESKLTNVVLSTTDMEKGIAFYTEVLGFKSFYRDQTSCFFKTGGSNLVLVKVATSDACTQKICLDVSVPDVAAALQALTEANVNVDASNPAVLMLNDPDGNLIEIVKG